MTGMDARRSIFRAFHAVTLNDDPDDYDFDGGLTEEASDG
jgi:hypothetical protein